MDRSNHYEAAFEAYLLEHRLCYIGVDETRRSFHGEERVKSLDFIVYGSEGARLLVDVKGRRFPGGRRQDRWIWECWSTSEDIEGLERWTGLFGPGYRGLLVFMYHILPEATLPDNLPDCWEWHDRRYLLRAVFADDYRQHMRIRSPRWGTVTLPGSVFRQLARPFQDVVREARPALEECPF